MLEEKLDIKNMIYEIRGKQVILDSDLAKLYCVETKRINEAVKNNMEKFPERFSFKLSDKESENLLVEFFDQKRIIDKRGGKYKNPRAFTEQGVAMLSTILKSKIATQVSINIMDAFVEMRKYISSSLIEQKYINNLVLEHDTEIRLLKKTFDSFEEKSSHIFFEGQIYDAYSLMIDIFNKSKIEIIIIDNYIDKFLFDILCKTNKRIIVITNKYNNDDYNKYIKQYSNIELIVNNNIHDRFIIIDKSILYHSGASFKDLGIKCFCISKIIDKDILNNLLKKYNYYK